jgi:hypothetical protein
MLSRVVNETLQMIIAKRQDKSMIKAIKFVTESKDFEASHEKIKWKILEEYIRFVICKR